MIMSRFLKELEQAGVRFAATSNTPPNALGQGRFAAEDFKREIQGLGERFLMISVDGEDYRHRDSEAESNNLEPRELKDWVSYQEDVYVDDFSQLLTHLATLHPTKFRALVKHAGAIAIKDIYQLQDQVPALRFVAFIDRMYEQQIPLRTSGTVPATPGLLKNHDRGWLSEKYLRAISRIGALCELY